MFRDFIRVLWAVALGVATAITLARPFDKYLRVYIKNEYVRLILPILFISIIALLITILIKQKRRAGGFPYIRLIAQYDRRMESNGIIHCRHYFRVRCLGKQVRELTHRVNNPYVKDSDLGQFPIVIQKVKRRREGVVRVKEISRSAGLIAWNVVLDPPGVRGEVVEYSFTYSWKSSNKFTFEEVMDSIRNGQLSSSTPWNEVSNRMTIPTRELSSSLKLPPGRFQAKNSLGRVFEGLNEQNGLSLELLKKGMFVAKFEEDRWKLSLRVRNPQKDLRYVITWVPPQREEILAMENKSHNFEKGSGAKHS